MIEVVTNKESPKWLKDKIESLGQKPISAIVDITNYVMFDLNRPLHAYDADKIDKEIIVRNSKKGETFEALDKNEYKLEDKRSITIGKHVIVGASSLILPGVKIGEGTAIYAMSMVTKTTEEWSIYFGIPAKRIKSRSKEMLTYEEQLNKEKSNS